MSRSRAVAEELLDRGPGAIGSLKIAFASRHLGVLGQSRMGHDALLTHYLATEEAHELSEAFAARRTPARERFGR
jgi:naphthoate synthase